MKSVRFFNSLITQMLLFLVMLAVAISVGTVTTQMRVSRKGTHDRYASQAEIAVRLAASFISAKEIDFYLKTLEEDDNYRRLLDILKSIQTMSGMTYVFVTQITDGGELFVFDTDPDDDTHMVLGSFSDWAESGIDSPLQPVLSAGKKPAPYISDTEWGFFLTAREPIYRYDGTTAGYAGANFYMGTVLADQASALRTNIIVTAFVFVISLAVYFLIVYKLVAAPLRTLTVNVGRLSAGEVLSRVLSSRENEFSLLEDTFSDMSKRNAHSKKITDVLNKTAIIFLSHRDGAFDNMMTAGVSLIADMAEIDRLILCRNHIAADSLCASEVYRWDRSSGGSTELIESLINVPYAQLIPDWEALLSEGNHINSPSRLLLERVANTLKSFGVLTAAVIPIHINNAFWGFALFGDTRNERYFEDDIIEMLRSAAFLFANAFIRADMERDIKEALNNAMEASKAKSDFLSNMSHEMRTPMNAILGITEIQLQDKTLPPGIWDDLNRIYNSSYLLLGIINDILDLSKIEAGKLELVPSSYDVSGLINDTVHLNVIKYEGKPIEFNLQVDENIPSTLYGDELRIKQILNNLLSNAFKYTDEGEVSLSVAAEYAQHEEPQITLVFCVSDTGQGMTPEQLDTLFDEYTRFNLEANRTIEGTGLGMSITKHLIRMLEGEISIESEPGRGSVFTVRLPQGIISDGVLGREMAENLKQFRLGKTEKIKKSPQIVHEYMPYGRVLIVDDVETNLYVAKGLMAPYGLLIETATSGLEAVNKIKSSAVYDIIFMDYFMPGMDGIEAVKIIRSLGYAHPIIALTANALAGQAEMFMENGFDGFIFKPIDIRQLDLSLNKLIRDKQPPEVIEAARQQALKDVQPASGSELAAIFVRDAENALERLNAIHSNAYRRIDDIRMFVINVHAMKSALANIGETELSAAAYKLEQAGRTEDIKVMRSETPVFLEALREAIERNKPKEDDGEAVQEDSEGIWTYFCGKLLVIQKACEEYDEITANTELAELRQKKWPRSTNELLNTIGEHLLHSDFEEAAKLADDYAKNKDMHQVS
ncbi:MAG: response regulator [Treponema sp.]|nr:response regulator [Treponema sp.]